jgi:glycosyltransferase involved in cell wall biosynthesis
MKVGIDLRPLQMGHKFRGIGEVAKQVSNRIIELASRDNRDVSFVFYEYDDDDPKELLSIPEDLKYEVIKQGLLPENDKTATKTEKIQRNLSALYGSPIKGSARCDVFLQYDYAFGIPKDTRTVLIKHDLIPYVFWDKYFESAMVHFKNRAARTTLRTLFANYKYKRTLRRSLKNAGMIISVSQSTQDDLKRFFKVSDKKLKVAHLGVDVKPAKTNDTSKTENMPTKPYLLFVGAGDARRRVDDLVAAYNNIKASGSDIQLVLVGENFQAPEKIPNQLTRDAVLKSSYLKDILTLGYVDDKTKQKLFKDALAFVYPTRYEGFGIPILEAMLLECPVITYKNSSVPEVGSDYALYAKDWADIIKRVNDIQTMADSKRNQLISGAKKHAEKFTWDKTAHIIYDELLKQ